MSPEVDVLSSAPEAPGARESLPLLLTVIVPVYNEARTIVPLLERVAAAPYVKQIVVVDDGSTDGTPNLVEEWRARRPEQDTPPFAVDVLAHAQNCGKGKAIRTGLAAARAPITIVQDADLEYDPADYPRLVEPIRRGETSVVYGSRYLSGTNHLPWTANRLCVHLLNVMVRLLYGQSITDEATCYKALRTDLLRSLSLECEGFEFCPEVTAKLCRRGVGIPEVPISYQLRTKRDGKKIRWRDGIIALHTLWRYRRWSAPSAEIEPADAMICGECPAAGSHPEITAGLKK